MSCGALKRPAYGHDPGGLRYSPLSQIKTTNVGTLHRAWTYHTGDAGNQFESTPIVVGDRMYFSTQIARIVALEPGGSSAGGKSVLS